MLDGRSREGGVGTNWLEAKSRFLCAAGPLTLRTLSIHWGRSMARPQKAKKGPQTIADSSTRDTDWKGFPARGHSCASGLAVAIAVHPGLVGTNIGLQQVDRVSSDRKSFWKHTRRSARISSRVQRSMDGQRGPGISRCLITSGQDQSTHIHLTPDHTQFDVESIALAAGNGAELCISALPGFPNGTFTADTTL